MMTPALATAFLIIPFMSIVFRVFHDFTHARKMGQIFVHVLSGTAIFVIIGPLIGFFVFTLLHLTKYINDLLIYYKMMIFAAYFFGALPALLAGIVAGALKPWTKSWVHFIDIGLVGLGFLMLWIGAVSNPFGLSFRASIGWMPTSDQYDILMPISGFISAILCTRILCGRMKFNNPVTYANSIP